MDFAALQMNCGLAESSHRLVMKIIRSECMSSAFVRRGMQRKISLCHPSFNDANTAYIDSLAHIRNRTSPAPRKLTNSTTLCCPNFASLIEKRWSVLEEPTPNTTLAGSHNSLSKPTKSRKESEKFDKNKGSTTNLLESGLRKSYVPCPRFKGFVKMIRSASTRSVIGLRR